MSDELSILGKSKSDVANRWVASAVALGLCVVALLVWSHYGQRNALKEARAHLVSLRLAHIELAKGFVQATLGQNPNSTFDEREGHALLRQAIASFEQAARRLGVSDPKEIVAFERAVAEFQSLLKKWRISPATDPRLLVALRVQFSDLERRTAKLDADAQRHVNKLAAATDRNFFFTLGGSVLSLSLIVVIVLAIVGAERRALAAQARLVAARAESEKRWHVLLQNLNGMVYRCSDGAERAVQFISEGSKALVGFAPADLVSGTPTLGSLIHPDDRDLSLKAIEEGISTARPFQIEYRLQHADGRWLWVLEKGRPVLDEDGSFLYLEGFITDITARKKAESALQQLTHELEARVAQRTAELTTVNEALARREEETRSLVETLIDAVIQIDSGGTVRSVNSAITTILGYTPGELVGRNVSMLMPAPHRSAHGSYLEHYLHTGERRIIGIGREVEGLHKDGHLVSLELTISEFRVQGERFFTGILRDITARKRAAEERARVTDLLNNVLRGASEVSIIATDTQGRTTIFNSGAERLFGYRAEEVIGKRIDEILATKEEVRTRGRELSAERGHAIDGINVFTHLPEHKGVESREWTLIDKRGQQIPVSLVITPMRDASGTITGYVGIGQNIVERKRIMQELEQARETAEAASRAKSAFLAAMSHEVRTPMNGVLGTADVLCRADLAPREAELAHTIRDSALNLLAIIDDILDFSKIEASRMELERERVDLTPLVEAACIALQPNAASRNVRLAVHVDPSLPSVVIADPLRLRQIVNNLVSNAIKFAGGRAVQGVVKVRLEPDTDKALSLTVRDNGIGMSSEVIGKLFSPFTQADVSTTRRFGGSGLGLSICKRLVDLMGGDIAVESKPGEGATFTVRLPIEPVIEEQGQVGTYDLNGVDVVLHVTDSEDERDWARYLMHAGARVTRYGEEMSRLDLDGLAGAVLVFAGDGAQIARLHGGGSFGAAVVQIDGADQRSPYWQNPRLVRLGGLITRRALCQAVAMAAGRASPDSAYEARFSRTLPLPLPTVEEAAASGQLVLVAEDHDINRKVIQHQLATLGYVAEFAVDGLAALELWRSGRHALLLTDLHMPGLDGYQLTAAIRAEEGGDGHLPIVAFTANAMHGEEARCLAAGMDGYLEKPVLIDRLQMTLAKWLPKSSPLAFPAKGKQTPADDQTELAVLDVSVLAGLVGQDPETIAEFLRDFQQSAVQTAEEMRSAAAAEEWHAVGAAAHRLKSSARSVGALALGEISARLELACKEKQPGDVVTGLQEFEEALEAVIAALQERLDAQVPR